MPSTWIHPELGSFRFKSSLWQKQVKIAAFSAFRYKSGLGISRQPSGNFLLGFAADSEKQHPSATQAKLATKLLADPDALVSRIANALWEDFNGRGPDSGMWWHNHLKQVQQQMAESYQGSKGIPPLTSLGDIPPLPRLDSIIINKPRRALPAQVLRLPFAKRPIPIKPRPALPALAQLFFGTPFESEHGLSLLADAHQIRAIGYAGELEPFELP